MAWDTFDELQQIRHLTLRVPSVSETFEDKYDVVGHHQNWMFIEIDQPGSAHDPGYAARGIVHYLRKLKTINLLYQVEKLDSDEEYYPKAFNYKYGYRLVAHEYAKRLGGFYETYDNTRPYLQEDSQWFSLTYLNDYMSVLGRDTITERESLWAKVSQQEISKPVIYMLPATNHDEYTALEPIEVDGFEVDPEGVDEESL